MLIPVHGEKNHGLFYYFYTFLSVKLYVGLQPGIDLEFANLLTNCLICLSSLAAVRKIIEIRQFIGVELEVFALWHGLVYIIIGVQAGQLALASLVFILLYTVNLFIKMEKMSQVLLIILTFIFVGHEVHTLQITGLSLILSISFKTIYVLVQAGKIQHKNQRLLL